MYIPSKDADLDAWATNFSVLVQANFAAYGILEAQADAVEVVQEAFTAALVLATNPATRTTPTVADKDAAKVAMLAYIRPVAQQINNRPATTDEQRADLGLTIRDASPTPVPAPVTTPILGIVAGLNLSHVLRYSDEATPAARKKPFGAIQIEIWRAVGTEPPAGPDACGFVGAFTKNPIALEYADGDGGKLATIYGRWVTRRGLVGPWSLPVSMTVPAST